MYGEEIARGDVGKIPGMSYQWMTLNKEHKHHSIINKSF